MWLGLISSASALEACPTSGCPPPPSTHSRVPRHKVLAVSAIMARLGPCKLAPPGTVAVAALSYSRIYMSAMRVGSGGRSQSGGSPWGLRGSSCTRYMDVAALRGWVVYVCVCAVCCRSYVSTRVTVGH